MIAQFALRLICGMSATWCLMPRAEVTCGFFRIQMLATMGLAVLAMLALLTSSSTEGVESILKPAILAGLSVAVAMTSYVGSIVWMLARRKVGGFLAALVFGLSTVGLLGLISRAAFDRPVQGVLTIGSELAAAGILGGAVTAMLLGHWYLTAPMMKLRPFEVLSRAFAAAVLVRGGFAMASLLMIDQSAPSTTQVIWLSMRWTAGILFPLILAILVPRTLRYRNTQAATGVLFAGVILVFIGESAAAVLSRDLHWPL